ncbi:FtsW/RodA/SpoVE family cell cycle protein [Dactylosporangium sp. NPDC005572]|uniref:FtsW/RodA/SpoVE family cell cycle protein n=1 Tax=Dactylosporangium sp. NPDC005572 TaxID=3156889 RepID=UPI0033BE92F0
MSGFDLVGQLLLVAVVALVLRPVAGVRGSVVAGAVLAGLLAVGLAALGEPVVLPLAVAAAAVTAILLVLHRYADADARRVAVAVCGLLVLGYVMQVRLVGDDVATEVGRWMVLAVAAFLAAFALCRVPGWTPSGWRLQLAGLALLLLPLVPGLGRTINDARAWIAVGGFTAQPAELARPLLLAGLALALEETAPLLRNGTLRYTLRALLPVGLAAGLLAAVHHDLGPALVLGLTAIVLILLQRPPARYVVALLGVLPVPAAAAYLAVARLQERVEQWRMPVRGDGAVENTGAALQALARGGWFGTGLGHGAPHAVANVTNDFVLVAIGEERGLIGLAGHVLLLAVLCVATLRLATRMRDEPRRLAVAALMVMLTLQSVYVVLATAGVVPVTGMVVPLLSKGGSALVATALVAGAALGLYASSAGEAPATVASRRFQRGLTILHRGFAAAWLVALVSLAVVTLHSPVPAASPRPDNWATDRGRLLTRDGETLAETEAGDRRFPLDDLAPLAAGLERMSATDQRCDGPGLGVLIGRGCRHPDVVTGLRLDVQRAATTALAGRPGSVVVLDLRDFSVLADVSIPSAGPALATPPGSTFKLVTGAAAIERGLAADTPHRAVYAGVRNADNVTCGGSLAEALAESCNTSFADYAVQVGFEGLRDTAARFGFGSATLADVTVTPSTVGTGPADRAALARDGIGLQDVRATPLQMAVVAGTIAAHGERRTARYVVGSCADGRFTALPVAPSVRVLRPATADALAGGMRRAVVDGTATRLGGLPFGVAAKTGTADTGKGSIDAWVVAYAPLDAPRVAVAVRVIGAKDNAALSGGKDAAPIAAPVLRAAMTATGGEPAKPCGNG